MIETTYILSGFVVGAIVGITGVGGGSLMTPLLVLLFGIAPTTAVATDLLYAAITKAGGVWAHQRRGNIAWPLVIDLALGSLPAALLTLVALHTLTFDHHHLAAIMSSALGIALILTALALVSRERLHRLAQKHFPRQGMGHSRPATIAVGATLGALVTLSSVGAGALGVTALMFLAPGLSAVRIVGTDIAHAVPLTLVAGLGHASTGVVDWLLLASLLIGSLPGIWLGSSVGQLMPERILRGLLATMLATIGVKLAL